MKILRMSREDFDRAAGAVSKRGLAADTLEMAACVLVDGENIADVVARYGKKNQQLQLAVSKIRTAYSSVAGVAPDALIRVELELPGELAKELAALSIQVENQHDLTKVSPILRRLIVDVRSAAKKLELYAGA